MSDPKLVEQKLEIGADRYGRRVTMTRYLDGGAPFWRIVSEPSSQRDDGERMDSLTDENIRAMTKALDFVRR